MLMLSSYGPFCEEDVVVENERGGASRRVVGVLTLRT